MITPMIAAFPPPTHLRGNRAAIEAALDIYRRALARFDRDVLEQAFQKAAEENEYVMWPKCADILRAAEHFHKQAHPQKEKPQDDWVERANEAAYGYTKRFMKTAQAAVRAREGGYEAEMKSYVQEAAWVQAQYIEGRKGVGYSSAVLFGHLQDSDERREAMDEFFKKAREQAERGHIHVRVPAVVIERLKQRTKGTTRSR